MTTSRTIAVFAGLCALCVGNVSAAPVPSQFVQTGQAAKNLHDDHIINAETAEKIGKACVELAKKQGVGVSVIILDQFGNTVYYYKMDGQTYNNQHTGELKAKAALLRRGPTHELQNMVRGNTDLLMQWYYLGFFTNSGGLPIIVNDNMIGAIGVGGSAPTPTWSDEICAHNALEQVLGPQPPLTADASTTITGARR
jgi:uncharacterized protein GlcG (DUF336 family)